MLTLRPRPCSMSPVGRYYASGAKSISLQASTKEVRAWPGGAGAYKFGSNYGPCINPQLKAAAAGFQQILWLLHTNSAMATQTTSSMKIRLSEVFVQGTGFPIGRRTQTESLTPSPRCPSTLETKRRSGVSRQWATAIAAAN